jgi:DNA-binding response OmpR family regulator
MDKKMNRILVIDDEEAIRKSFVLALEGTEYQMDTAESGKKGIEMEKGGKYDLIFLDLKMPGLNGVETLRELRKIDEGVPIYIITAFYEEFFEELKGAEKDGIEFEVLRKPFSGDQILLTAKSILKGPIGL